MLSGNTPTANPRAALLLPAITAGVFVLLLAGCNQYGSRSSVAPPAPPDFSSPGSVYTTQQGASATRAWGILYDTFTPESRQELVGTMVYGALMAEESSEAQQQILAQHGIDDSLKPDKPVWNSNGDMDGVLKALQAEQRQLADLLQDQRTFYIEMKTLAQNEAADIEDASPLGDYVEQQMKAHSAARLLDVEIDKEKAVGQRTWDTGNGLLRTPVYFQRIDDKWYVRLPTFEEGAEMGRSLAQQSLRNSNVNTTNQ